MRTDHEYHPLTVAEVVEETDDTRTFVLDVPDELAATFAYRAGQFCTFRARLGGQGADAGDEVARCYSMSSSPEVGDPLAVTVKRVPGGRMSNWLIDTVEAGAQLDVLRPAGLFVLGDTDAPIVAFAGGSGITPVFSIIKTALATTTRDITLVYANRDAGSVIFADALAKLAAESGGRLRVHAHLDDEAGFLTPEACAELVGGQTGADIYVCGPGPYMDTVEAGLERLGVAPRQVFIERFVVPDDGGTLLEASATETVVIRLNRQKRTADYHLGDTILETARRAGMTPPFSCEGGSCATCMAQVVQGSATMRVNNALTPDEVEEGWVLTCQAVPASRELVVDYDA
jgi:3-ketosteroid 9alpha-monooxygenase subunit B